MIYLQLFQGRHELLWTIYFRSDDVLKIIKNIDPSKAHGHDISIWIIKICDVPFCKLLELIFRSCFENGKFPTEWKKFNAVAAHK